MRVVLAGMMMVAAFAGCLGGSDEGGAADVLPDETVGDDGLNGTVVPNRAPLANLTSDAADNGTAPLNVTFQIRGSDADGDGLTWTLTLGNETIGNGTSLPAGNATPAAGGNATSGNGTAPGNSTAAGNATGTTLRANVTHQFAEPGNYTVVLNVTDGTNSTLSNLTITVHPGEQMNTTGAASEDDNVVFNADGTCDAKGEIAFGPGYAHDRGLGSLWIYEESNDIEGLQVGGSGEEGAYQACLNPDTLRF